MASYYHRKKLLKLLPSNLPLEAPAECASNAPLSGRRAISALLSVTYQL
jgi:hypothetical protein